jgi:hypothetical protein
VAGGLDKLIQEVEEHIKQVGLDAVKGLKGENVCIPTNSIISDQIGRRLYLKQNYYASPVDDANCKINVIVFMHVSGVNIILDEIWVKSEIQNGSPAASSINF